MKATTPTKHDVNLLRQADPENLGRKLIDCKKRGHGNYTATEMGVVLGRTVWTQCPECEKEAEKKKEADQAAKREEDLMKRFSRAGIPKRFIGSSLDEYETGNREQKLALKVCQQYVDKLDEIYLRGTSLIFCGKPGTGKTHLACAILIEAIKRGFTAKYSSVYDLVSDYKRTFGTASEETESSILTRYCDPGLLILDEVGVQFGTSAELVIIFRILNQRYNAVRPTILITNHSEKDLETFIGEQVVDRLRDNNGALVKFIWNSYRKGGR